MRRVILGKWSITIFVQVKWNNVAFNGTNITNKLPKTFGTETITNVKLHFSGAKKKKKHFGLLEERLKAFNIYQIFLKREAVQISVLSSLILRLISTHTELDILTKSKHQDMFLKAQDLVGGTSRAEQHDTRVELRWLYKVRVGGSDRSMP